MSTDPSTRARLLIHPPFTGADNMAIDSALLEAAAQGRSPLTLRVYSWSPAAVSLGRFQSFGAVDVEACHHYGLDIVSRPTGGRGVLHDDEVTYSIVGALVDGIPRGVEASYAFLLRALSYAFSALGVNAELVAGEGRSANRTGACYLSGSSADLCVGAAKLSGSAQVWKGEAVLQHGSFVRSRDVDREADVFLLRDRDRQALRSDTATLEDLVEGDVTTERIQAAIAEGFSDLFGRSFEVGALTDEEHARSLELADRFRSRI